MIPKDISAESISLLIEGDSSSNIPTDMIWTGLVGVISLGFHLFPVHTFAKVNIKQNNNIIEQFDINFLEELIEQNKIKISHEKSGQNIILTASTGELQKFVVKYASDEDAFFDPIILNREFESRE